MGTSQVSTFSVECRSADLFSTTCFILDSGAADHPVRLHWQFANHFEDKIAHIHQELVSTGETTVTVWIL